MPTIIFTLKEFQELLKKRVSIDEASKLLEYCKAELESYDKASGELTVKLGDTNLPYLWCVEGIALFLKRVLGKEKGIAKLNLKKANYKIVVERSVKDVRPFIASFVAKGKKIDDYMLRQIIQLQEKLSENYGRKRQKLAIGVYPLNKISFPIFYKAVKPESISFMPLDSKREMNLKEILKEHPQGINYACILKDKKEYPLLIDSKKNVLSFPPVINSELTGRLIPGEKEIFFEATGTDMETVMLASCIFALALQERGFEIYSVDIVYQKLIGKNVVTTPKMEEEKIKLGENDVKNVLGIELKEKEFSNLLEKAGYEYKNKEVTIPYYRKDIMHAVDIIEDIAIVYGYGKIKEEPLHTYTRGSTSLLQEFTEKAREFALGLGYQEMLSFMLTNKESLYKKTCMQDLGTVEINEPMSESYSVVRTWLIPSLLSVLEKNKHIDYPQKIFEQGVVSMLKENDIVDHERIALASSHAKANFTEMKQALDFIMNSLGFSYSIEETEHSSFIEGRVGRIIFNGKKIGFIGEISPAVLKNFELRMPVVALELNLGEMHEIKK